LEKCGGKSRKKRSAKAFFDAFSCFFLSREERRGLDEERKKTENFFGKRGKGKNKVEKRVLDEKENGRREKKCERGVRSIDRKRKKFDPIIELSNLNWRHNLNATYVR
tara:strand:- start:139 stop:462 length:324 start_codon:yes stop_codon:yes gene_type:complete